ncbi:MAG: hypothetical protein ABI361_01990 [Nitrososphaera sp.]
MVSSGSGRRTVEQTPAASQATDSSSLGNVLTSCLDLLKIEDESVRKKAVEFVSSVPTATVNTFGKRTTALKAIADACAVEQAVFSQSQVCDFLTVAASGIDPKRVGPKAVSDSTFQIYVDIMENYAKEDESRKIHYPRIIVDAISALDRGVDTRGVSVGVYGLERYYQARKNTAITENPEAAYSAPAKVEIPKSDALPVYAEDLVDSLAQITGRSKKDVERSLSRLQQADVRKISDLSANFSRLQKYSKISNPTVFKKEAEKDLGKSLSDNQLQHASNSIRKVHMYIENILDNKFLPHGTHGINHVKHNLEYGYQLMGLMEPRKRRAN